MLQTLSMVSKTMEKGFVMLDDESTVNKYVHQMTKRRLYFEKAGTNQQVQHLVHRLQKREHCFPSISRDQKHGSSTAGSLSPCV